MNGLDYKPKNPFQDDVAEHDKANSVYPLHCMRSVPFTWDFICEALTESDDYAAGQISAFLNGDEAQAGKLLHKALHKYIEQCAKVGVNVRTDRIEEIADNLGKHMDMVNSR